MMTQLCMVYLEGEAPMGQFIGGEVRQMWQNLQSIVFLYCSFIVLQLFSNHVNQIRIDPHRQFAS